MRIDSVHQSAMPHLGTTALYAVGAALGMCFLHSSWDWLVVVLATALCTAAWLGKGWIVRPSPWRWVGAACWVVTMGSYALWTYLAVAYGTLLGWTVSAGEGAVVFLATLGALLTSLRGRERFRVPYALPMGLWIVFVLTGWLREEGLVRCDDYLSFQAPVELVVPTDSRLTGCRPGERRASGRIPRTIWESHDGRRVVFTTSGERAEGGLDGGVCEAELGSQATPHCVGAFYNKSQGLYELPEAGKLIAFQWGIPAPSGDLGAVVYELSAEPPLRILAEHWYEEMVGEGFFEPRNSTLYMYSDRMNGIHRALLPDFKSAPALPIRGFIPGEIHYDTALGEGVACGDRTGTAIRGDPFVHRFFADTSGSWLDQLSMSWGCDWDPVTRKVYSAIPNFGWLVRLDYETGKVDKRWFIGLGKRSVAYDPTKRRVYYTDFLRGTVEAFDEQSEQVVARWFVGRFSRWVRLSRDGRSLLATSNLGIVRIRLAD